MKKISKKEIVEDTSSTVINYTEMSESQVTKQLLDQDLRNDFIFNYPHFEGDRNRQIFVQWIFDNLSSHNNELLENIFDLAASIDLFNIELLSKAKESLNGRCFELTKLAVLDWILINNSRIEGLEFYKLNLSVFKKTKLSLVKLQAAINLTLYDDLHISKVHKVLSKEIYPTGFYRLVNSFDYIDAKRRDLFANLILNNFKDCLESKVFNDLEFRIKEYTSEA